MTASVQERRQELEAAHPVWHPMTLSDALDRAAARYPDRPLILSDSRTYTYAELRDWSRRLAAGLVALGVQPGEHVAIVLANYPEFVALSWCSHGTGTAARERENWRRSSRAAVPPSWRSSTVVSVRGHLSPPPM